MRSRACAFSGCSTACRAAAGKDMLTGGRCLTGTARPHPRVCVNRVLAVPGFAPLTPRDSPRAPKPPSVIKVNQPDMGPAESDDAVAMPPLGPGDSLRPPKEEPERKPETDPNEWPLYIEGHDLRGARCRADWEEHPSKPVCVDRESLDECPPTITPPTLTSAENGAQWLCTQTETHTCQVRCTGKTKPPHWTAEECPNKQCKSAKAVAEAFGGGNNAGLRGVGQLQHTQGPKLGEGVMVNLRGLHCELKEGREVCFRIGASGERELCPDHVNSAYLSEGAGQWLCSQGNSDKYYCVATCQEGHQDVQWGAHEIKWCNANPGNCPPKPELIDQKDFRIKKWSVKPRPLKPCEKRAPKSDLIPEVTFGVLANGARETKTLSDTLATYEQNGLLKRVTELLVFVNARNDQVMNVLKPYEAKYGKRFKVMSSKTNHGITWALNWLAGNATQPYLLFLEKDFQLVDPVECVREQVAMGLELIKADTAQVVRYRSRDRPGNPNWAEKMFRDNEEAVFGRQPNLFCNHYYWIPNPEERWPDKIWRCMEKPSVMYCSKAKYCNWTNNPLLMATSWWQDEYVEKRFPAAKSHDPYDGLEPYMNWERGSWNDEPFVVAQGDGLFKHVDRNNFA